MLPVHHRIRLANRLLNAWRQWLNNLDQYQQRNSLVRDLERSWSGLWLVYNRLLTVEERSLTVSSIKLTDDFHARCYELIRHLHAIRNASTESGISVPTLRDWLAEFNQIDEEFDEFTVDWKQKRVRVVTEPITLMEVELGSFAIELDWTRIREIKSAYAFDIIALEPNPSREKSQIVHPHVQDRMVCIGDADKSLNKAMEQGRLCDAFVLIRSVLTTYNPNSAYADLKDWHGQPCSDCGDTIRNDESYGCERCEREVCSRCSSSCELCESNLCHGCLQSCDVCEKSHCRNCRVAFQDRTLCKECIELCIRCKVRTPKDEYDDDTGLCKTCQSETEEEEPDDEPECDGDEAIAGSAPAHV